MSITYTNAQIGTVNDNGDINVIYPVTSGENVSVTPNANFSSGDTIQKVVSGLGASAFKGIEDDYTANNSGAVASSTALYNAYNSLSQNSGGAFRRNAETCRLGTGDYMSAGDYFL